MEGDSFPCFQSLYGLQSLTLRLLCATLDSSSENLPRRWILGMTIVRPLRWVSTVGVLWCQTKELSNESVFKSTVSLLQSCTQFLNATAARKWIKPPGHLPNCISSTYPTPVKPHTAVYNMMYHPESFSENTISKECCLGAHSVVPLVLFILGILEQVVHWLGLEGWNR